MEAIKTVSGIDDYIVELDGKVVAVLNTHENLGGDSRMMLVLAIGAAMNASHSRFKVWCRPHTEKGEYSISAHCSFCGGTGRVTLPLGD